MENETYYEILEVPKTASQDEIKSAYVKIRKAAHPDRGGSNALFRIVTGAYETLRDPVTRAQYDADLVRRPQWSTPFPFQAPAPAAAAPRGPRPPEQPRAQRQYPSRPPRQTRPVWENRQRFPGPDARYHPRAARNSEGERLTHAQRVSAELAGWKEFDPDWFVRPYDRRVQGALARDRAQARHDARVSRRSPAWWTAGGPVVLITLALLCRKVGVIPAMIQPVAGAPYGGMLWEQALGGWYHAFQPTTGRWVGLIIGAYFVTAALVLIHLWRARRGPYDWYEPLPFWLAGFALYAGGEELLTLAPFAILLIGVPGCYLAWVALTSVLPKPLSAGAWTSVREWLAEVCEEVSLGFRTSWDRLWFPLLGQRGSGPSRSSNLGIATRRQSKRQRSDTGGI